MWIDDDAIPRSVDEHFAELDVEFLCVRPFPHYGLSDRHMRDIDAFLDRHR